MRDPRTETGDSSTILLLHDGELEVLENLLRGQGIAFDALRGGRIGTSIEPSTHLVVATPRRASAVLPGGSATRIALVDEDSTALRSRLRDAGFDLLVRSPVDPEIWRLLVSRALYTGDDRRGGDRIPVGGVVSFGEAGAETLLLDLSPSGCRLLIDAEGAPRSGSPMSVTLPAEWFEPPTALELTGEVVRATPVSNSQRAGTILALRFDDDFQEGTDRERLAALLSSLAENAGDASPQVDRPRRSRSPGRSPGDWDESLLDEVTSPLIGKARPVDAALPAARAGREETEGDDERRVRSRGSYSHFIRALGAERSIVLMGRDLSSAGLRIEPTGAVQLGDRLRLAVYGPSRATPYMLSAEVIRDDGDQGLALRFLGVSSAIAEELEKLVASLPQVEALQEGESAGLGAVLSEILLEEALED